jgi:hypothetical protein
MISVKLGAAGLVGAEAFSSPRLAMGDTATCAEDAPVVGCGAAPVADSTIRTGSSEDIELLATKGLDSCLEDGKVLLPLSLRFSFGCWEKILLDSPLFTFNSGLP